MKTCSIGRGASVDVGLLALVVLVGHVVLVEHFLLRGSISIFTL